MNEAQPVPEEEPPPFLGTWQNVYAMLIVQLVVTIAIFYAITWWAS